MLLACATLFAAATSVQAQTTLVSNTGQTTSSLTISLGDEDTAYTQGFTTGSHAGGYNLASVGVYVADEALDAGETNG